MAQKTGNDAKIRVVVAVFLFRLSATFRMRKMRWIKAEAVVDLDDPR